MQRYESLKRDLAGLGLTGIEAISVATYIEQLGTKTSKLTIKQYLAAISQFFDYLTKGGILTVQSKISNLDYQGRSSGRVNPLTSAQTSKTLACRWWREWALPQSERQTIGTEVKVEPRLC